MSNIETIFLENIKYYREIKNISQKELAEITGMGQGRLSRIENGKVEPGLLTIEKIAEGLQITVSELMIDMSGRNASFQERISLIEHFSEYDQNLVDALLESLIEKTKLARLNKVKMNNRLEELNNLRRR